MCSKLWLAAIAAPLGGGFQQGFHMSVFNLMHETIDDFYNSTYHRRHKSTRNLYVMGPVTMATLSIGAVFGSLVAGVLATEKGRNKLILSVNGLMVLSLILMCFAKLSFAFELLIIGRLFLGFYVGFHSSLVPIYLVEIASDDYRGVVGSMYGLMVSFGSLFSIVMSDYNVLGDEDMWPVAIAMCCFPTVIHLFLFVICPDSPKYLIFDKKEEEDGEAALMWLRGNKIVDDELDDLNEELDVLTEIGPIPVERMFTDETIRNPLIICTVIMLGHHFCGAYSAFSYSFEIIKELNFSENTARFCVYSLALEYFTVTIMSVVLVEMIGRKFLLLISFGGMTITTFCLSLSTIMAAVNDEIVNNVRYVTLVFYFFFVLFFACGAGTIPWFITQEMHNHRARPTATAFVTTIGWVANFIYFISFSSLRLAVQGFFFIFFFFANLIVSIFLVFTMRETMKVHSVDIIEMFYD